MSLSVCMIVRDSAKTLRECLEGITPWVDELVVVDTGSLDDTVSIAQEFRAKVHYFRWCDDFSAARNVSIEHASGDWLFWMDSDDTIDAASGERLRKLALGPHRADVLAYVAQVVCPGDDGGETVVDHVKLFRNHPGIRFEFRIHEQLLPSIRRLGGQVAWSDVSVVHSGSDTSPEGKAKKYERDLRILQLELQERPEHSFALFNFGMTYADMERYDEAVGWLKRCLAASAADESHVRKAFALLVMCLAGLDQTEEAIDTCERGLSLFPQDAELHFRRGMLAHGKGDSERAIGEYYQSLTGPRRNEFSSLDPGIAGYKARHNMALAFEERRDYSMAELQWREALRLRPQHQASRFALIDLLLRQGRLATAGQQIRFVEETAESSAALEAARAKLELCSGRADLAATRLEQARHAHGDEDGRLLEVQWQVLIEMGEVEQAIDALRQLNQLQPANAAALHNLGAALLSQGCAEEAVECLEKSLRRRPENDMTTALLAHAREQTPRKELAV